LGGFSFFEVSMSSSARPASSLSFQTDLRSIGTVLLVIAALAAGFLWAEGHDDQRCIELVLLALLVPFMLARRQLADQIAWTNRAARRCLGVFLLLGATSALGAISLRHAIYEWSMLLLLMLAAALLAAELARLGAAGLQTVLRCVVAVGLLYAARILPLYAASLGSGVTLDVYTLAAGFSNARFFNHVQTALLPLVVLLYLQAPKAGAWRWAAFSLAAFWWAFLFLTQARASVLALSAGCVFAFALRRAAARSFLKAMLFTALAGVLVYMVVFMLLPMLFGMPPYSAATDVLQRTAADPTSRRVLLWELSFQLISTHPWLGVGPHHFAHEGAKLSWGAHPHNFVLQIGAEWGLPALLCLLSAIGIGMRALVRSGKRIAPADSSSQQTLAVMLAAGAAILVDGLFSGVIVMPQSQMAIVLYLGCAAGWVRSLDNRPAPQAGAGLRRLSAGLTVMALCGLAYAVAPSVVDHAMHAPLTPAERAVNPNMQWPRLWEAGYF
jgi:putative inorganic carbon (HCO3(-)) transporter